MVNEKAKIPADKRENRFLVYPNFFRGASNPMKKNQSPKKKGRRFFHYRKITEQKGFPFYRPGMKSDRYLRRVFTKILSSLKFYFSIHLSGIIVLKNNGIAAAMGNKRKSNLGSASSRKIVLPKQEGWDSLPAPLFSEASFFRLFCPIQQKSEGYGYHCLKPLGWAFLKIM